MIDEVLEFLQAKLRIERLKIFSMTGVELECIINRLESVKSEGVEENRMMVELNSIIKMYGGEYEEWRSSRKTS